MGPKAHPIQAGRPTGSVAGVTMETVRERFKSTNPQAVTGAGQAYAAAAGKLAQAQKELAQTIAYLSQRWKGPAATEALQALGKLRATADELTAKAGQTGRALQVYGESVLPWYQAHLPADGLIKDGGDDKIDRLDKGLAKITGQAAVAHWEGNAREEYVNWRNDFKSNTLEKFQQNMWDIKGQLDEIHGNIWSIRGHVVALVIEAGVLAGGIATAENPVSIAAAVVALVGFVGTFLDYQFRVRGDLDEKGRKLQTLRDGKKIDRGGGAVSLPFNTQVIGDWDNWQNKQG